MLKLASRSLVEVIWAAPTLMPLLDDMIDRRRNETEAARGGDGGEREGKKRSFVSGVFVRDFGVNKLKAIKTPRESETRGFYWVMGVICN